MSLDQNLFTLIIAPSKSSPSDTDLSDPFSKVVSYRKIRATRPSAAGTYEWSIFDPYSGARLATVTAPLPSSKKKIITLHDPDVPVEFTLSGTMSPKWSFKFEDFEFEWKKDSCYVIRKPDPPVIVCTTRAETKDKPASVQILDYNVKRFEIDDRKGLEVLLLCGLLTFTDYTEGVKEAAKPGNSTSSPSSVAPAPPAVVVANVPPTTAPPAEIPKLPPRPVYNFTPYAKNEVLVTEEATVQEYAQHCLSLLGAKDLLYIIIKSHTADDVSKVVQVSQETKRLHYREVGDEEELHQYVRYGEAQDAKGKKPHRVIKLDDAPTTKKVEYKPPASLSIHLSKIELPDLKPTKPSTSPTSYPPVDTRFGIPMLARPASQATPRLQPPQSDDRIRRHSFGSSPKVVNPPRPGPPPRRISDHNRQEKQPSQLSPHPQSRPPKAQPRPRPVSSAGEPNGPKLNRKPSPHYRPDKPPGYQDPKHEPESRVPPGGYPQQPTRSEPSKQSVMGRLFGF